MDEVKVVDYTELVKEVFQEGCDKDAQVKELTLEEMKAVLM